MNIAVLGGSFNPPHLWHYLLASQVLENNKEIDRVWLMPDFKSPYNKNLAPVKDRISMLQAMQNDRINLSTIASSCEQTTYTFDVVKILKNKSGDTFFWLMGSDSLEDFSGWKNADELPDLIKFLVYPRIGSDNLIENLPPKFTLLKGDYLTSNISSRTIRDRVRKGLSIKGLVFPHTEKYIRENALYLK